MSHELPVVRESYAAEETKIRSVFSYYVIVWCWQAQLNPRVASVYTPKV